MTSHRTPGRSYEEMLARKEELQRLAELAGKARMEAQVHRAAFSADPYMYERLKEYFSSIIKRTRPELHPFTPMPTSETETGNLDLGSLPHGADVRHSAELLDSHALIVGPTKRGKSTLTGYLLKQVVQHTKVWVFDPHGEYHKWLGDEIRSGVVYLLDAHEVKRGLFETMPGESPRSALARVPALFRRTMFVRDGGENIGRQAQHELYLGKGVYEGSDDFPTLEEFVEHLQRMKRRLPPRELEYWSSLWNRINGLWLQMPDTYNCVRGFSIPELLNRSIIFRAVSLSENPVHYRFFVDDLLTCALTSRRLEGAA